MKIVLRTATANDAALIADLSRQTFYETFAAQNTKENMEKFLEQQFTRTALMAEVDAPGNTFLLAEINGEAAGYVRLRQGAGPEGLGMVPALEIARIYVLQSAQGKGVGNALMQECIAIAQQRNLKKLWLGVWEANSKAIAFYTQWGFQKFGETVFLLGDDLQRDWLMEKELY